MTAPRRILFSIGSLDQGGAELQLTMLATDLAGRGWDCHFFVFNGSGVHRATLDQAGITVHACDEMFPDLGTRRYPRSLQRLVHANLGYLRTVRRVRPGVTQSFLPPANALTALWGRVLRVPVIVTGHRALQTHQDRARGWKLIDTITARLTHAATANSVAVAQDALRSTSLRASKLEVIPNGMDLDRFSSPPTRSAVRAELGLPSDAPVVMVVANLIPYKGHIDLLHALPDLTARFPRLVVVLVGADRGVQHSLATEAERLGVLANLRFHGSHPRPELLLPAADVFALPSHEEGFPNALIEAMATGTPVVATAVGGVPEALDGGRRGLLVPPRAPVELARAIAAVLDDPVGSAERAAVAKQEMRSYDRSVMAEAYESLYERLLAERDHR